MLHLLQSGAGAHRAVMQHKIVAVATLAIASSAFADPHNKEPGMKPIETYTVTYAPGPQWKADQPMDKQDLGGHLEFVNTQYGRHALVAHGHLGTGKGFYVFALSDPKAVVALVATDPGVDAGVL